MTKICRMCHEEKDIENFTRVSKNSENRIARCKSCRNKRTKELADKKFLENSHFTCGVCHETVEAKDFGRRNKCKKCQKQEYYDNKESIRRNQKAYEERIGSEVLKQRQVEYKKNNLEKSRETKRKNREKYKDRYREMARKTKREKKEEYKARHQERLKTDPNYKIKRAFRSRFNCALLLKGHKKASKSLEILGCSLDELRKYLESLWLPGMTWENHGSGPGFWEIDHRLPCNCFLFVNPEAQKICFHYTNLQPLWWEDNQNKSDKILSDYKNRFIELQKLGITKENYDLSW